MGHPDLSDAPVLILANKQDLPDALPPDIIRNLLDLDEIAVCRAVGVVALNGDGLAQSLQWLLGQLPGSNRAERLRQMRD
ncbi:hypothetical protein BVRB_033480 [Beta vulgaris subsp. vulgaris]|uniref:Uncharacterized protein n=1 Tax=Beta vulgaris subsp. vulgaris TaxID=3555 RepID=A0A0J8AMV9_BETVV|nr:hypothetical protein BVRB_033480 [Beta vulgaris subsp. vulgaris]